MTFIPSPLPEPHPDPPSKAAPATPVLATFRKSLRVRVLFTPSPPERTPEAIIVAAGRSGYLGQTALDYLVTSRSRVPVRECPRRESDREDDHCLMAYERNRDALRGYFEFFKHLSTISTTVLVIVLVLYRDLYLDPALALLSLVAFGVSVLASFCGMFVAMNRDLSPWSSKPSGSLLRGLLYVAAGALGGAVLCLIASVAGVL
jgi:hypothetical protein